MKFKQFIGIAFPLTALGVCAWVIVPLVLRPGQASAQQASEQVAQNTPEVVYFTPSPEPSPTIGYQATIEVLSVLAAGDRQAALESREREIAARETANAAEVDQLNANMTLEAQANERASIQATESALRATESAGRVTEAAAIREATEKAPAIQATATEIYLQSKRDEQAVKLAPLAAVSGALFYPILGLMAIMFMVVVLRAPRKPEPAETTAAPRFWERQPVTGALRDTTPPGDRELFAKFAEYALAGELLGINSVCGTAKAYPRTEYARDLLPWLQRMEYIGRDPESGGLVLNSVGREAFTVFIAAASPSSAPVLPQNSAPARHDYENNDHADGGGVVGEPKNG